ncbi:MAG: adenosylcobinamide-GDP ribazoletransferase [Thermodesulfobacteriota bacterium]|nr:adenosylcobinamide-GDP ribazoletransferase [Thermodesulfobacteriota bacterium]
MFAIQFLTIIPLVPGLSFKDSELKTSLASFPLVGLLLGCLLAGFDSIAKNLWSPSVMGVMNVALLAFLTRGLHLDGLADTSDALGSGAGPEKALSIMRDSHSGALGILVLILVLLLKSSALAVLSGRGTWEVMLLCPCLSRWGLNVMASSSIYARPEGGLGKAFVGSGTRWTLALAGPTALGAAWFLWGLWGIWFFAGVVVWSLLVSLWFKKRLGGVTGDVLGGHLEISETLLFIGAAAIYGINF